MSKRKVLVVDDDEAVLDYLRAKLGARYDLVATQVPEAGMDLARRELPEMILCDIDMPGMDGGDISAALFADDETRDIPVLFLSALLSAEKQVGGRHAIAKRAPLEELLVRIAALLTP